MSKSINIVPIKMNKINRVNASVKPQNVKKEKVEREEIDYSQQVENNNNDFKSSILAQSMFEQKVLFSQQEKEIILNKFFSGSNLTASEVNKIQSTLTHMYDEDIQKANQKCETSQKEYNDMAKEFSKLTGSSFDIDKMKSLKSEAQQEALRMAKEYKDNSFRWNDFDFDEKGIYLTREQFEKMSVTELSEVLLKNDVTIGTQYKRFNSILSGTQYGSLENFLKKMSTLQDNYSKALEAKNKIEAQVKGLSYALMSQTEDYKNFKTKSVSKDGITDVTTIIQNDQNIATQQTIVDYSKYVKTYGEVDPLSFTSLAMQMYGDNIEVQGVTNPELLKELAKVQSVSSLSDMGKYYQFAYQNFGSENANKYLTDYESEIHQYCGEINANEFLNHLTSLDEVNRVEAVTNHLKVTGKGLSEGMTGFFSNLGYLLESPLEENRTVSAKEYENMYIVQALSSKESKMENGLLTKNLKGDVFSTSDIIDYTKDYGALTEHNYQISESIGNMLPSIAVSAINPFAGSLALGASAAGGSYHSAMTEGYSVQKSMLYGVASGASEVLMEKALGGLPLLSDTKVVSLKTMAQAMGKEFNEEFIQTYVDAGASSLILQKDFDLASTSKEALQSGIYGGITGGIMNLPSLAINSSSIKMVDNQVKAGKVSQEEIVQSFHELIPETQPMNYDEILQEYSTTAKDVTLSLVQANGKTVASSGVRTLLGSILSKSPENSLGNFENLLQDIHVNQNTIQSLKSDISKSSTSQFSNALKNSLNQITEKMERYYKDDIQRAISKSSIASIPKATVGFATSIPNLILKGIYHPVTSNTVVSEKILNQGLYHITDPISAQKIIESGNVRASNSLISLGVSKSFFFAGIPSFSDIAINLLSVDKVQTAVKIDINESDLSSLDYRAYDDGAVTHKGDLSFPDGNAHLVYLGLDIDENGKLYYKEISESEYHSVKNTMEDGILSKVSNELKSIFIAMAAQADIMKNNAEHIKNKFEPAFAGVQNVTDVEQVIVNNSDVNKLLVDMEEEGLPIRNPDRITFFNNELNFFDLSKTEQLHYIENANMDEINRILISSNPIDFEVSNFINKKIIENQNVYLFDNSLGYTNDFAIENYVVHHPQMYSELSDQSLVTLIHRYPNNQELMQELYKRIDQGSDVFMRDFGTNVQELRVAVKVFSSMSTEYQIKVRDSIIELSKTVPADIKELSKNGLDMFDQAGLFYAYNNHLIDDVGLEFLKEICNQNKNKIQGMNFRLLNSEYLDNFGSDFINSIINDSYLSNKFVYLHDNNTNLYNAFLEIYKKSLKDNTLYTLTSKINSVLPFLFEYQNVLKNVDIKLLTSEDFVNYILYLNSNKNSSDFIKISNFSENYGIDFNKLCDKQFDIIFNKTFSSIDELKNIFYNKYFSSSSSNIKSFIAKYETSIDSLMDNGSINAMTISFLKYVESIKDKNVLKELYDNCNIKITSEELLYLDDSLRKSYVKTYIDTLEKTSNYINSALKNNENVQQITIDGKSVSVIDAGDEFSFIVRSSDSGLVQSGEKEVQSYKKSWYESSPKNHILSSSYITQTNLGSCPVHNEGVLYGFTNLDDSQIVMMGVADIHSNIKNVGYSSLQQQRFVTANEMSNYTRRIYNEVDLEKNGTKPDCVIIYDDSTDLQVKSAYRAAAEWDIPVVRINKVDVATRQSNVINSLMDGFKKTKNISYLKQALDLYESNCSGYKLNSYVENNINDRTSVINNKSIYDLGLFDNITIENDILDYIHELSKMEKNSKYVDELAEIFENIQYKYDLANYRVNVLANTKSNLDLDALQSILKEIRR